MGRSLPSEASAQSRRRTMGPPSTPKTSGLRSVRAFDRYSRRRAWKTWPPGTCPSTSAHSPRIPTHGLHTDSSLLGPIGAPRGFLCTVVHLWDVVRGQGLGGTTTGFGARRRVTSDAAG